MIDYAILEEISSNLGPILKEYYNCTESETTTSTCSNLTLKVTCKNGVQAVCQKGTVYKTQLYISDYLAIISCQASCTNGQLKLFDTYDHDGGLSGRLLICSNQRWRTLSSVFWTVKYYNSEVACKELGFGMLLCCTCLKLTRGNRY